MRIANCSFDGRFLSVWVSDSAKIGDYITPIGYDHSARIVSFANEPSKSSGQETREGVMSVALLTSHDLVKSLQAKLADYQALVHAPDRVEVVPTVFVDKEPIMSALKTTIKAEYSKLGEQLKKL